MQHRLFYNSMLFQALVACFLALVGGSSALHNGPLDARQTAAVPYWYAQVQHNGISPTITNGSAWTVFRNVKDFGAKGDGVTDDAAAIQAAIVAGNTQGDRASGVFGMTQQPAVVYFPPGTYLVNNMVQNLVDTVLLGDPTSRPVIKAGSGFNSTATALVNGRDPRIGGLGAFMFEIKNFVFDTTELAARAPFNVLTWDVSQLCQLQNVMFNMPIGSQHVGIIGPDNNAPLIISDLQFVGGAMGFNITVLQYHIKNVLFQNIGTGLKLTKMNTGTGQGLRFENVSVGIDARGGGNGFFALIDSSATNTAVVVAQDEQQFTLGSLVVENFIADATVQATVAIAEAAALTGSVMPGSTWIRGHAYNNDGGLALALPQNFAQGQMFTTTRPASLVNSDGAYFTAVQPTYADVLITQVVNVKNDLSNPVRGDGVTDDTASLQAILNAAAAANQLVFFPHGIYLLTDTLTIPPGSRLVGEAWSEFSATGDNFKDPANTRPMIRVGNPGERGVAQFSDFIFTVADILPGAVMVEVNMAGTNPGDVAFFNSHFRLGGARGSAVSLNCANPLTCNAARTLLHLTATSSSYWENSWAWGADHDLDNNRTAQQNPSAAGGILVEATGGTWLLGMGSEHHVLYQFAFVNAQNVFSGLSQGETPYWQGNNSIATAPQPWQDSLAATDPDFSWCAADDQQCRMAVYLRVINSTDVSLYSGGFWNFMFGQNRTFCAIDCQDNTAQFSGNTRFYAFGLTTVNNENTILEGPQNAVAAPKAQDIGSAGGMQPPGTPGTIVAAYLRQSGDGISLGATPVVVSVGAVARGQGASFALPVALLVVALAAVLH